tara:strand:+ start:560 stop:916 length:357 start_codon:yes stop_codon:yes gene_type:complete
MKNQIHDCRVLSVNYKIQPNKVLGLDGCFGICDNNRELIEFETSQSENQLLRTIIHELLHAVCYQTNLNLSPDQEEQVVSQLSLGIFSIIEDPRNHEVISWLISLRQSTNPDFNQETV